MIITADCSQILLEPGQSTRLTEARTSRLASAAGTLWITIDNDPRDIVLEAGEGFEVTGDAPVIVGALGGPAVLSLVPACSSTVKAH
jgi:Protein of unknown function (DUF2917)